MYICISYLYIFIGKHSGSKYIGKSSKQSSNIYVVMKKINKGTSKFMYFIVLHGIAQIPVWEAQNQARNGLKRTCIRHYKIHARKRSSSHYSGKSSQQSSEWTQISMHCWMPRTEVYVFKCLWFCMGQLKFQCGRLKIKRKMGSNEHVYDTKIFIYIYIYSCVCVNTAAQSTLGKVQNRAQNEFKQPCSNEKHQQRYKQVYVFYCFAWDSSNSSVEGSKSSSKWAQTKMHKTL